VIKEIAFTAYPVRDVAGVRAWYEQMLGLKFDGAYAEDGIDRYDQANVNGGGYISLMWHEWMEREPGSGSGVVFEVDDIDAVLAELRAKGVAAGDPYATPVCKVASLDDPEGNRISLHQRTAPY